MGKYLVLQNERFVLLTVLRRLVHLRVSGCIASTIAVLCTIYGPLLSQNPAIRSIEQPSNLRQNIYTHPFSQLYTLDSMPVVVRSIRLVDSDSTVLINLSTVKVKYNKLEFDSMFFASLSSAFTARLIVDYRVLPIAIHAPFRRIDTTLIQPDPGKDYIGFSYQENDIRQSLVDFQGMNYSGSFSRGLSFGNRQNLVLNSSLNLQLAGTLGNDLKILAAISDNDIPIQPEGNTQQLQEFDRIFIEISKDKTTLRAGDFEIGRPQSYFMNYFKRSQGVLLSNEYQLSKDKKISSSGSLAISKGKFRRQFITPQEGNQGPYKLLGNDGETFIIVLANTEKVFLDGELLKRGLEYDYVIDYNRGDIQFTARRLIHKDLRIIVEFEYTDQNYLRSMYTAATTYESKKWRVDFNFFSEQDSPNSPGTQQLSEEDLLLLSQIGDDLDRAFVSGIRPPPEESITGLPINAILYEQRDTILPDGRSFQGILLFSSNPDAARVTASFTDVGIGNGDYIIGDNLANGRVFQWVAPDPISGQRRGRFVPSIRIVTPKKQQMMTLGAQYLIDDNQQLKTEVGWSSLDINRYSPLDNENNTGVSAMVAYQGKFHLDPQSDKWTISPFVHYELKQQNFRAINQYRSAEFQRDWNVDVLTEALEHLSTGGIKFDRKDWGSATYSFSGFLQQDLYTGGKHDYDLQINRSGFLLKVFGSEMLSTDLDRQIRFSRPRIDISQRFKKLGNWQVGIYMERERNEQSQINTGDLAPQSFFWDIGRVYIRSPQDKKITMMASATVRDDILPLDGRFTLASRAQEYRMEGGWRQSKQSHLTWNFTSRVLDVTDTSAFNFRPQATYLGRINYNVVALKNVIRSTTAYEIGSGQEPRLEFTYIEVRPGEGQYIWSDINGDGIQQLDEFQIAPFQDEANFIRVANITNEFVRTNNVLLNQQFLIDPRAAWFQKKGWKKYVAKLSMQTNLNLQRKSGVDTQVRIWDPFQLDFDDPTIVFLGAVIRNGVFLNRANPKFELQWNINDARNRNLLTTGFESRRNRDQDITARYNPSKILGLKLKVQEGDRISETEAFTSRNFSIRRYQIEQEVIFQPGNNFRTTAKFNFITQQDIRSDEGVSSDIYQISLESTLNKSNKYVIRANLSGAVIQFDGQQGSPIEFTMLEGLKDGLNFLWNTQYEQRMANNIQLIVNYEGRRTGLATTVHVFRMQMRATF